MPEKMTMKHSIKFAVIYPRGHMCMLIYTCTADER